MARVYYDCEFLEGTQTRRILGIPFGKTKPTIDLISIGMVRDDGQEYYAISKDFNLWEAWNRYDIKTEQVYGDMRNIFPEGKKTKVYWIRENVLKPIFQELLYSGYKKAKLPLPNVNENQFTYKNLKKLIKGFGKSNKQIASEVIEFCSIKREVLGDELNGLVTEKFHKEQIELYGYYSAYDHVALCWLFGKMIDLPSGFPMYTKDLKQIFDEKQKELSKKEIPRDKMLDIMKETGYLLNDGTGYDLKKWASYPKNKNEHSAISDARWNKELHEFLKTI